MKWKFTLFVLLAITLVVAPGLALAEEDAQTVELDTSIGLDTIIGAGDEAGEETGDGTEELENPGILPDSPFYGLKQFGEKLQLMFTFNQKAKIKLNMKLAEKRLAEAERMIIKNKPEIAERVMVKYRAQMQDAEQTRERLMIRNIILEDVDEYMNQTTSKHIAVIQRVMQNAPEQAQSGLQAALQNAEMNKENIKARVMERIERIAEETGTATQTQEETQTQAQTGTEAEGDQTQTQEQTGTQSGQSGQGQSD